jgi:RHS repeat-associated protein
MTIDAANGLLSWTNPVNGNYQVVVAVFDSEGLGVTQGYTLTAKTNSLPVIRSTPGLEAVPNQTYRYDLQAVDPDGDSLRYSLDATSQALGMTLDAQGRLTWTPNNSQLGDHAVTLTAIDGAGGATEQTFTLKVTADTTAPQVRINHSLGLINQGETVSFQVVATDNVDIANLQLLINDTPVVIDSNGVASFTATTTGVITAKAVALDAAGNRGEATTTVNVLDPTDTEAPTVDLDLSGIVNGEITAPVEIKGSVNDTNLDYYALEVAPADGSQPFKEMFRGTSTVENGVLGVLDPTLLPNDTYQVRLVAYDVNGLGMTITKLLDVKGDLKLGNFQLSFTDLEIPVSGIPITLTRTYDTLTSNSQDDFGYGWRMEFRNTNLRTSLLQDDLYQELGLRGVGFQEGDSVYVTLPGGKRERFTFKLDEGKYAGINRYLRMAARRAGMSDVDPSFYIPSFVADSGSTSTLTVPDSGLILIHNANNKVSTMGGGSAFSAYNPQDWGNTYTLTTKEGVVYDIDATTGDINTITNRNGDILNFSDGGIVSSNGQQVTFERDAQGRIVAAIDPMGNRVSYRYDANGDLVKVTDRENNTTTFEYNGQQAHYLDKIIDPLGKTGVRNEYDENGRLTKVFNALGNSVQLEYNPDNSLYTTKDALGNATTYEYDLRGNVITEVDAKGGITRRTYDEDNNQLSATNSEGETNSSTYDSNGNKLTETDALGNVTRYTYNAKNDLLSTTDALGNTVTSTYDSNGNPTAISGLANGPINLTYGAGGLLTTLTTAEGTTTYEYDGRGNVTKEVDPLGYETTYTYDGNGNRLTETRKLTTSTGVKTLVTTTEYNAKGDVIKVTDALGNVTQMAYDANGQKTQEIDALGRVTKYVYSDAGQLLETIYADATPNDDSDNPRTRKEYDAANRVIAEIDELGRRTEFQYDALGRLTFTLFPDLTPNDASDNPRKESRYDDAGRVIAEVDERGNITRYEYDALGRRTKTILPDGTANNDSDNPQFVVTYDALGRQLTQVDPLGRTTQFLYDSLGRSIGQIFADQTDISTTYDLAGRVVGKTDQMGNKTQYEYNAVGQLTAVIDALNQRTEYQYNELGNLISQKDALGNTTRYEYDVLGRRIGTDLPLGQEATMTYDAVGNLLTTTDFNGETIHFEYDERNRLLSRIFPDNSRVAYTYTLTGQRATETSSLGTITYSYDVRDNLLSRVDADGVKIEYSYDAANNRTAVKVPSGQTSYSFDEQNRLKTVTDPQAGVTTYSYDLAGNLIKTTLANGTTETREYDLLNRLLYVQNSNSSGVINSFRYSLDKVGNRLSVVEQDGSSTPLTTSRTVNYDYDALYRLLKEEIISDTTRTISYSYDVVSNRLTRNDSLEGNTGYEYDGNDRLLKEVTNGVTTTYTYDNNGNTLTKTVGTAKTTYEWDIENRLVGADTDGDGVNDVTNEYDGDGIRIRQTVAGEETRFLVDKNRDYAQVLEEYTPSKIIKASYIYGHDLISQLRNTERSFYHVDGLGSTRALTDINGLLTDAYAYEAFGEMIKQLGNTQNSYLFAGEQRDPNLGLDYLRARYLDVNSGRFYGRDPFEGIFKIPNSLHPYIYTGNNSVNLIDPSGLSFLFTSIIDFGFQINSGAIVRTSSAAAARNQFLRILFGRPPQDIGIVGEYILQSIISAVGSIPEDPSFKDGFKNKGAAGTEAHKRLKKEIDSYKPIAGVEIKSEVFRDEKGKPTRERETGSLGVDIVVLYHGKEVLLIDLKIGKGFSGQQKNKLRDRFNGVDLVQVFIKTK